LHHTHRIFATYGRSDKDIIGGVEQFVSCENSMGVVQMSKGNLKPVSNDLRSESVIVCELAQTVLSSKSVVPWSTYAQHYDYVREAIEKCIPGFENYNIKVRKPGGFYLPNSARDNRYPTQTGKANFNIARLEPNVLKPHELMMMTVRSHDQFNTTIYGLDDRYRGVLNERRVIFINEEDAKERGLKRGDKVDLYNYHGGVERVAHNFIVIPFSIPRQCTATYFPEANVLVPIGSVAEKSNTPTSKYVVIELKINNQTVTQA
jgi:anaerobic selenocysteine-containing dehydrogenase